MKIRKLLAIILALITVSTMIAACGDVGHETATSEIQAQTSGSDIEDTTSSDMDDQGYKKDDLAESYNFGKTITMLYDTSAIMQEFLAEDTNGEFINDALYSRNAGVEKRLGVTLNFVGIKGGDENHQKFADAAQLDAESGDSQYDIYGGYSRTIPLISMKGTCANLLDSEYFNVDQPWWPKGLTDQCTINNRLYFCSGDISTNLLWQMSVMFYNKALWENANFEKTPEEYVQSGEWTFEKFNEIVKDFYMDDGDGVVNTTDTFGLCGYVVSYDAFLNFSGILSIIKDKNGDLVLNPDFNGDKGVSVVQTYGTFCSNNSVYWDSKQAKGQEVFLTGHSLFITDGIYIVTKVASDGDGFSYGLVPGPKFTSDQPSYCTNMRNTFNFYAVNKMSKNVSEATCVIEAEASASYRGVTPILFELTMKSRYADNDVSAKMFDIVRDGVVFDFGRLYGYSLTNFYPDFRSAITTGGNNWVSTSKSIAKKVPDLLKKITQSYKG